MTTDVLSEAEKIRRVPGIYFADDSGYRVPKVAGTGLAVFEVVQVARATNGQRSLLERAFHWLSQAQIDAALAYGEAFPDEINDRLALEAECYRDL